ncbi:golgi transport 1Ba [Syngnathus typhle]|uniref:golgi transport 1Ba n=1 Tax=Syngnathus typhle TaxID=161592 RepID=UPI002A699D53|nr:golgi transport 1Ba [Syngnathus typhle]
MISLTDSQKIGMGLTGFGVFFLFFGMILFFDKALLAIGNILFVAGLAFVIGLERTFRFFFQKHKMKATSFFLGGVCVVLIGWPIIGVVLEVYGFFLLFRLLPCCNRLHQKDTGPWLHPKPALHQRICGQSERGQHHGITLTSCMQISLGLNVAG